MTKNTWVLKEDLLPVRKRDVVDILFTLGNGILGVAGIPGLAPRGVQGMFAGGMYADGPAKMHWLPDPGHAARDNERFPTNENVYPLKVPSLIACPRPFATRLKWNGKQLDDPKEFVRSLDLKTGMLTCECTIDTPDGALTVREVRLVSLDDLHVLAQRFEISGTVSGSLEVALEIDASVRNQGEFNLWADKSFDTDASTLLWQGTAEGTGAEMSISQRVQCAGASALVTEEPSCGATLCSFALVSGAHVTIDRFVGVGFTTYDDDTRVAASQAALTAAKAGFEACAERHAAHWEAFWRDNDISIDGPELDQTAVRYALFQLHCATPPPDGRISFGAKFLSGEWYRACVFWDDDVFIAPYLTRAQPAAARSHFLYRYKTLEAARESAKNYGNAGARYSLESLPPGGDEATLPWLIFGVTEIHTNCGVAWGILDYLRWTGDKQYVEDYGAEILDETARFWMSRFTETKRGLELHGVCGPDEYHPFVNNSVYTCVLARENLKLAAELGKAPDEEKRTWLEAADRIFRHQPDSQGVIEQCDGFFDLPDWKRGQEVEKAVEYQLLKQADVVMLPLMMPELYPEDVIRANYEYYEPHTVHCSSLSTGAHAIVAARLGMIEEAYDKFRFAAYMQIEDRLENTNMGLHAACIGMVPRIVMEGFAGLCIKDGQPAAEACLPASWNSVEFPFSYHGRRYRCRVKRASDGQLATITPSEV